MVLARSGRSWFGAEVLNVSCAIFLATLIGQVADVGFSATELHLSLCPRSACFAFDFLYIYQLTTATNL